MFIQMNTNNKHGKWTILYKDTTDNTCICRCDCGRIHKRQTSGIVCGKSTQCRDCKDKSVITHGETKTRLYSIWNGIKDRCNNSKSYNYYSWGGRGIKICKEWDKNFLIFKEWALTNGYNESLTIDRIDTNLGYCPDNCRWADKHVQSSNRRIMQNNTSGYTGINKRGNSWVARIMIRGKRITLGQYKDINDAIKARKNFIKNNNLTEYSC